MKPDLSKAERLYERACLYINDAGLMDEVRWQQQLCFEEFCESDLLREHAWVVLCSGFKEAIVRKVFDQVSLCFCDWESARCIVRAGEVCQITAEKAFGNYKKLSALLSAATLIYEMGFANYKASILADPISSLQRLPYIGPITTWHLAKNLGHDVAKPDRHLVRVSNSLGFQDANHLCGELSISSGHSVRVVDLIIWRFLADVPFEQHESIDW